MGTSYSAIIFFNIIIFVIMIKKFLWGVELSLTKAIMLFCAGDKRVL